MPPCALASPWKPRAKAPPLERQVAALAIALAGASCAGCAAAPPRAPATEGTLPATPRVWEYRVRASAGARELSVEAALPAGVPEELGLDAFAHPFLRDLELETEQGWRAISRTGHRWVVPHCRELGCRLRYVYRLGEAARRIDRFAYAGYRAGVLMAPPSTFLLAPQDYEGTDPYRFRIELPPGESFVTGVWREASTGSARPRAPESASPRAGAPLGAREAAAAEVFSGAAEVFSAPASVLFQAPFSAFGVFERERLEVQGGQIELAIAPGAPAMAPGAEAMAPGAGGRAPGAGRRAPGAGRRAAPPRVGLGVSRAGLRAALHSAAAAVSAYYGRFPVPRVAVIVLPSPGGDIFGMQLGNGGASIVLFIGAEIDDELLARHWVITHELLHLGFPTLGRRHLWLAEGLATYQEPIARARAGLIDERELWRALLFGMPKGLPSASDGGLDGSMRWGRTYWGGALFCLLLDVEVRARTDNRLSLDAAARAILLGGGDTSTRWTLERTLTTGDAALDRPSLAALYAEHSAAPVSVDLDELFRRLGVRRDGDRVDLDDTAALAHVRRAIGRGGEQAQRE